MKLYGVNARFKFPFFPSIVVFGRGQAERFPRLGLGKNLVSQFAREKARQDRVVRLPNNNKVIALILDDHCAALCRSRIVHAPLG
jgi:hypothetical protein